MSDFRFFNTHRTWEDWCGMLLGLLIALSPWFPTEQTMTEAERRFVVLNTLTIGLLVFALAQLEYVALQRWEEVAEILAGLWLIASPYMSSAIPASAQVLAFHSGRTGGAARRPAAMAGLGPERAGSGQAWPMAAGGQAPPVLATDRRVFARSASS